MKRIYISDIVHEQLKREAKAEGRTLQWVVEKRLTGETPPTPKIIEPETPKNKIEPTAAPVQVDDLFALPDADDIRESNLEQDCCKHPSRPCKHWVWDTDRGDGYRNTLSGRFREAD